MIIGLAARDNLAMVPKNCIEKKIFFLHIYKNGSASQTINHMYQVLYIFKTTNKILYIFINNQISDVKYMFVVWVLI